MVLSSVTINNYKSYAVETTINCSKLNVLAGTNSSGKTSFIESLLILGQLRDVNFFNGHLKKLGDISNLKNKQLSSNEINFIYKFDDRDFNLSINDINPSKIDEDEFNLIYLAAERIGIQDSYPKNRDEKLFDADGRGLISLLFERKDDKSFVKDNTSLFTKDNPVFTEFENLYFFENDPEEQIKLSLQGKKYVDYTNENGTFLNIVNMWFQELTGYTVEIRQMSSQLLQLIYQKDGYEFEPQHVGTGITFILFQLIALMATPKDYIVIIENPEIHLHPSLQSQLMYFYRWISNEERQIFIETHSDHIFNVAKYFKFKKDNCIVNFFKIEEMKSAEHGTLNTVVVKEVQLDSEGNILDYPDGLFDQYLIDNSRFYKEVFKENGLGRGSLGKS